MDSKPLVRFCYAHLPGVAAARYALKDVWAPYLSKPEYDGALWLAIGSGLILDIGANRGQSIAAFRKLVPQSRIIAFEPEPLSASRLRHRFDHDATVTVHHRALGATPGKVTFFVPSYGYWNCDGMSATDYVSATSWLRDPGRMYRFNEAKLSVSRHEIVCDTLDSYGLAPRLIKLHAQGAELDILRGSEQTISEHKPALMCAFPTSPVNQLLAAWGYCPHIYSKRSFAPGIAEHHVTFTWYLTDRHLADLIGKGGARVQANRRLQAR